MRRAIKRLASAVYEALDTPTSLACHLLVKYGEWDQLVKKRVSPHAYEYTLCGANSFKRDYQAVELLRKFPNLPLKDSDPEDVALANFHASEHSCAQANYRLARLHRGPTDPFEHAAFDLLERSRKWIARRLGRRFPEKVLRGYRWGPGVNAELRELEVEPCIRTKCWTAPGLTPAATALWFRATADDALQAHRRRLGQSCFVSHRGNVFTTVPKDATQHRGICIEPGGNLQLQLAVGNYFKERLFNTGLFLLPEQGKAVSPVDFRPVRERPDAQVLHRLLAREGSIGNHLATIDLSSASDTLCIELVRWLLPSEWFYILDSLRSPVTLIKGTSVYLDKFSSMGNGFTFELETLIFASLAHAVGGKVGRDCFVFGDDIIVPRRFARDLMALLRFVGFTPNERKTFTKGPFRESCGGDFFLGIDVAPLRIKSDPEHPHEVAALQQELVKKGLPWKPLLDLVTKPLYGPKGLPCFIGPPENWQIVGQVDKGPKHPFTNLKRIRVYKPISKRLSVRTSQELDVKIALAGGGADHRPEVRGVMGSTSQLIPLL